MRIAMMALIGLALASVSQAQVIVRQGGPGAMRATMGGGPPGPLTAAPSSYGVTGWRVGDWVRYSIVTSAAMMPITQIRTVSIVGQQEGRYWVETQDEFVSPMQSRGPVRKILVAFGVMREVVGTEAYTLMPDSSVRRETLVRAASGGSASEGFVFPHGWQQVGEEEVTVAAGTMRARRWRKGEEHLWVSADAGPVGLVKYQAAEVTIELGSRGTGAKSQIPFGGGQ